jgi:mevalonate kinase
MIKVSAPGKIHLLGEHSVVYGKPAILAAINLKVHVTISKKHSKTVIPANAGIQLNNYLWIPYQVRDDNGIRRLASLPYPYLYLYHHQNYLHL